MGKDGAELMRDMDRELWIQMTRCKGAEVMNNALGLEPHPSARCLQADLVCVKSGKSAHLLAGPLCEARLGDDAGFEVHQFLRWPTRGMGKNMAKSQQGQLYTLGEKTAKAWRAPCRQRSTTPSPGCNAPISPISAYPFGVTSLILSNTTL